MREALIFNGSKRFLFTFYFWLIRQDKKIFHKIQPDMSKPVFACSKLRIETLEQGVKYVQS